MSDTAVTREGQEHVRPGREARMWDGGGKRRAERPVDHPGDSYYGNPVINPPVWEEREIAGYLFTGGLAGASSLLASGAQLTGRPRLARRAKLCASGAITVSLLALVKDLGRPERFLHMLRVFKVSSPMSVGTWILTVYAPLNMASTASELTGRLPRVGRVAGLGAAAIGPAVASYTAALIADTAVPAWHAGHRELPFVFVGSAASAAAGWGLIAAPRHEAAPVRRMAIAGATLEMVAEQLLERRLGMIGETMHEGIAGRRLKTAKALAAGGILGAATLAPRSRLAAAATGVALLAASALTRFGIFAAGMASAKDPKYTVIPQRNGSPGTRRRRARRVRT
jgi:formate-dependent nitrite reductase membrane component NrfD